MSRETISFNTLKSFIKLGQTAQNRQDGGLHGARSFKKATLLRVRFPAIHVPRFLRDPSRPYLSSKPQVSLLTLQQRRESLVPNKKKKKDNRNIALWNFN